jgi:hypothetical protein
MRHEAEGRGALSLALRWFGLSGASEAPPVWLAAVFVVVGAVLLTPGYWATDVSGALLWLSGAAIAIRGLARVIATRSAARRENRRRR